MNKQFNIKPAQLLKSITKTATKVESNNILKFALLQGEKCCDGIMPNFVALPQ